MKTEPLNTTHDESDAGQIAGKRRRPKQRRFTVPITVYITPDQKAKLEKHAETNSCRVGAYARRKIFEALKRCVPVNREEKALKGVEISIDRLRSLRASMPIKGKNGAAIDSVLASLQTAQTAIRHG